MNAADIATLAASTGTLVLAGVALYQACQAKAQIRLSAKQLKAAEKAATEASDVHREAVRSRVDQFAPRIAIHYGAVSGPHYSNSALTRDQRIEELDSYEPTSAVGKNFALPKDEERYIWFSGRALIVNDGDVAARVRLPVEATFISGHSSIAASNVQLPPFRETGVFDEAVLPPGRHALFEWSDGRAINDWAAAAEGPGRRLPGGSIWLWTVIFDTRSDGTIDTHMALFEPELLSAVQGMTDVWQVAGSAVGAINSLPFRRNYRSEGAHAEDVSQMHEYHSASNNE